MPASPLTIAIDVDDVILNTSTVWARRASERLRTPVDPTDWHQWDLRPIYGDAMANRIYDELATDGFYDDITPLPLAQHAIAGLRAAGVRCLFVTRELDDHRFAGRKWTCLLRHGIVDARHRHDYIEIADKSLIRADMLIDDGPHNLLHFPAPGLIMDRPWNRAVPECARLARVRSWAEILKQVAHAWGVAVPVPVPDATTNTRR